MKRVREKVSLALLVTALLLFVVFHFLHFGEDGERGWTIWLLIWNVFHSLLTLISQPELAVVIASFLTFTVLVVASSFLGNVWKKSRLAWGFATTFSGMAVATFWGITRYHGHFGELSESEWCLLFATVFNFTGLLLARGRSPGTWIFSSESGESAG